MRELMAKAEVGDDVYGEDPTVNLLQETAAALLGKEAALFLPSGTQSNLTALLTHCDAVKNTLLETLSHIRRRSGGGRRFGRPFAASRSDYGYRRFDGESCRRGD